MAVAHREYIRCVKGCDNNLRNLACLERIQEEDNVKVLEAAVKRELAPTYHPNRTYAAVERFLQEHERVRYRYKFLVLTGPSGMGKTQFVRNLASRDSCVLELNCAWSLDIDLKDYRRACHDFLFDEASPACIIKHKKFFLRPPCLVTLGQSATAMYTYKVCVHQKHFVVCANGWHEQCAKLPGADIEWLQANSHVVVVSAPMWMS